MSRINIQRHVGALTTWRDSNRTFRDAYKLEQAMERQRLVEFDYDGKRRIVEVHALGTSTKDGSLLLRGFQVGGDSSRPLPQWTLYTVSKLSNLEVLKGTTSLAPRQGYVEGDAQMAEVLSEVVVR